MIAMPGEQIGLNFVTGALPIAAVTGPGQVRVGVETDAGLMLGFGETEAEAEADLHTRERSAFVRRHVRQIIAKMSTARSASCRGKKLLERAEAVGDTGWAAEARDLLMRADEANKAVETHILALIERMTP